MLIVTCGRSFSGKSTLARALARAGRSVVVDDTSSPRFLRDRWSNLADAERTRFVLVFVNATGELIRTRLAANRQVSDRHDVVDQVIEAHLNGFEPPTADEAPIVVDAEVDPVRSIP